MHDTAHPGVASLIPSLINFGILVAILYVNLKKPLAEFIRTRHQFLHDELHGTAKKLREAQARHDEFSAKLKAIDAEVAALKEQARQDAEGMKLRVIGDAKKLSTVIVTDARSAAEGLYHEFKSQLRADLAKQVLNRAEQLLRERLTGEDRARIRREFSQQVGAQR